MPTFKVEFRKNYIVAANTSAEAEGIARQKLIADIMFNISQVFRAYVYEKKE